jgi:hypothetical protein
LPQTARAAAAAVLGLGAFGVVSACSVETLEPEARPAVPNTCKADSDCGTSGVCTKGACYSRNGNIDEVLLEILPEATSPLGGISFLSMQTDLRRGDRARSIALTAATARARSRSRVRSRSRLKSSSTAKTSPQVARICTPASKP